MGVERRYCELRGGGEGRSLAGALVRYGDVAVLPWGVRERIEPGAFGADVVESDVVLNVHHDRSRPIARTQGGGLELTDGADALAMSADLPETREADDALALVRAGVLRGLSVEFRVLDERLENGTRVITRARLEGAGVVDKPAYPASKVQARTTESNPWFW